jgi:hypothetical protein
MQIIQLDRGQHVSGRDSFRWRQWNSSGFVEPTVYFTLNTNIFITWGWLAALNPPPLNSTFVLLPDAWLGTQHRSVQWASTWEACPQLNTRPLRRKWVEVWFHILLTSALVGSAWLSSLSICFTPGETSPSTHWIEEWVGPSRCGPCERRNLVPLLGIKPSFLGSLAHGLVTILTELSHLLHLHETARKFITNKKRWESCVYSSREQALSTRRG